MSLIATIRQPKDLKTMSREQLRLLAQEIRQDLLARVTETGGHIGPNLGVVELTIALHYVFDSPSDKIVFDVSHQSYVHKMLTGRYHDFMSGQASGYSNPQESAHDLFMVGHTSTAVSLAVGLATGRDLVGGNENVIAVVGDGALSGGEAFEGLDNAACLQSNLIIIVNDNDISIAPNHGGIYRGFAALRQTEGRYQPNWFEAMGLAYRYVEEGNDIDALIEALRSVKDIAHPIVLHIHTHKGLGLDWADSNQEGCHWVPPHGVYQEDSATSWRSITADWLVSQAQKDKSLMVINAATPGAAGLTVAHRQALGQQFVDVGICEEHAVALASGIATRGGKAVYLVFSSFVQRTYDQLLQDMALNHSPCVVLVYGGGIGCTDPTHAAIYDVGMISNIPGILCLSPVGKENYLQTLQWAVEQRETPVVIRIPSTLSPMPQDRGEIAGAHIWHRGKDVAFVALGEATLWAQEAADRLQEIGIDATVVNHVVYSHPDVALLDDLARDHRLVVTLENATVDGGIGQKIAAYLGNTAVRVLVRGIPKQFVPRQAVETQKHLYRLDAESLAQDVSSLLNSID